LINVLGVESKTSAAVLGRERKTFVHRGGADVTASVEATPRSAITIVTSWAGNDIDHVTAGLPIGGAPQQHPHAATTA
jgi:hypothetical protein